MKDPVIIGSAPSSGSTLLRVILSRHPSIASGGEVALFDKRGLLQESPESYRASIGTWVECGYPAEYLGPSEELFEELGEYPWDRTGLRDMCLSMPDYPAMLETFYSRNVSHRGAQRWLDKCPSNIYCFDLIAKLYPHARFIHIVRDARDSVVSYCRRGATAFRAVSRWYFANLNGVQYSAWPNYLRVRYEDLVSNPESVVRTICDFLDEPYLETLVNPAEAANAPRHTGWRYSERGPVRNDIARQVAREMTDGQRAMFTHVQLSLYGAQRLSRLSSPRELQQLLGYPIEGMEETPSLSAAELRHALEDFERYRTSILLRHGTRIECPVMLSGLAAATAGK